MCSAIKTWFVETGKQMSPANITDSPLIKRKAATAKAGSRAKGRLSKPAPKPRERSQRKVGTPPPTSEVVHVLDDSPERAPQVNASPAISVIETVSQISMSCRSDANKQR